MFWVIVIIGIVIYFVIKTKKEQDAYEEEMRRKMAKIEADKIIQHELEKKQKQKEQTIESFRNSQEINSLKKHWIWMTLAGGTDPLLHPQVSFEDNDRITFTKQGYDLWTGNLNQYYTGTIWEEREKALIRFEKDLFGKYAGKLGISIEYIADHLIQLENRTTYNTDYTLSITIVASSELCQNAGVRSWLREELYNTRMPNFDELP